MAKGYVRSSNLERHPAIRAGCRLRRPRIGRPHLVLTVCSNRALTPAGAKDFLVKTGPSGRLTGQ
eukprot:3814601-Prymnesium_polylepis.1